MHLLAGATERANDSQKNAHIVAEYEHSLRNTVAHHNSTSFDVLPGAMFPFQADLLRRGAQEDVIQSQLSKRSGTAGMHAGVVNDHDALAGDRAHDVRRRAASLARIPFRLILRSRRP